MKRRNLLRKVAVALDLEYATCRDMLTGISDYIHRHRCLWQIKVISNTRSIRAQDLAEDFDGLILDDFAVKRASPLLRSLDKPIVVIGSPNDFPAPHGRRLAFVHNDNLLIGRLGAKHLTGIGRFRSFGFVQSPDAPTWSRQRQEGFCKALHDKGIAARLQGDAPLSDYLRNLPKPAAVMCTCDKIGTEAIAVCNAEGIRVPKDLVVLGVDNDHVLCDISSPPLSSIQSDHRKYGVLLATALDRLFRSPKAKNALELINGNFKLVRRKSTTPIATSIHLVDRAISYIRANALCAISVDDVVDHLGVSRQLAYLRFGETSAGTISKVILKTRLAEVASRLRNTRLPIVQIAKTCSFDSLQYLANVFKRQYGVSMTEYRNRTGKGDA